MGAAVHWRACRCAVALTIGSQSFADPVQRAHGPDDGSTPEKAAGAPIVITGSRIPRTDLTAVSPVTIVKGDEFRQIGATNVEDLLNQLPQVNPSQGEFVSAGAPGTATIDLRGLGAARTLVLVNGHRLMPAFAFGVLTPAGGVPVTGSATYSGTVRGQSDVIASDSFNGPNRAVVEGSVNLDFNFASGSLTGAMSIGLNDAAGNALGLGTYSFRNTVFGVGSTSYSGKFDTAAAGDNFFLGQFTGPHAEETIGAWALPFILNVGNSTIEADHHTHQAFGAWIAKKP